MVCLLALSNSKWSQRMELEDVHPDASTNVRRGLWAVGRAGLEAWLEKVTNPRRAFGCPADTRWQQMTMKASAQPYL